MVVAGGRRSKSNQYENTSLVQIEGVNTKEDVAWYAGKRMAYIYKAKTKSSETRYRCIWGKVTRPHGNSGVVRAKFKSNLPPESMVSDPLTPASPTIRCVMRCLPIDALSDAGVMYFVQGRKVRVFMYPSSI